MNTRCAMIIIVTSTIHSQ